MIKEPPIITPQNLSRVIRLILGNADRLELTDHQLAQEIVEHDPDELHCHIEFPGTEFNAPGAQSLASEHPVIYSRIDWKICQERRRRRDIIAAWEREVYDLRRARIQLIKTRLMAKWSLPEDNAREMAAKLYDKKAKGILYSELELSDHDLGNWEVPKKPITYL